GSGEAAEVFGHHGFFAVRDSVPAQVSGTHSRRYDFQRSGSRCPWGSCLAALGARDLPLRDGESLPGGLAGGPRRRPEAEQARLHARVGFDFEGVVGLPRDMEPAGGLHDDSSAVTAAWISAGFIACGVPAMGDSAGFRIDL